MPEPGNKLLVIDDQPDLCEFISEAAAGLGFESLAVTEPDAFRRAVQDFQPTVVVLDLQMPGADGIELLRYLGERGSKAQVLVASGMDQRVLATAQQIGKAQGLTMLGALQKPILLADLEVMLRQCLRADSPINPAVLHGGARGAARSRFTTSRRRRASARIAGSSKASRRSRAGITPRSVSSRRRASFHSRRRTA